MLAIEVNNLCYTYPKQVGQPLSKINLNIEKGERFGLFGPNGAGKTTLIQLLTGVLKNKEGSIRIQNEPLNQHFKNKRSIGFVPQDFAFYDELNPIENLKFFGAWSGLNSTEIKQRTEELLNVLGLYPVKESALKTFSGGMKRRINLAIGIIHKPEILFLDEPTVGVDVQTKRAIINYLLELNRSGTTLVYTSHQLEEAEKLCTRISMINEGKIITEGLLNELLKQKNVSNLETLFLQLTGKSFKDGCLNF
ncbi:MAG: ABC transporter ATP-binding protein [Flavobacteriales bacterium]|nr:ABC transporter ATP-binding protein [Flavobacteriales bacterium]